MLPEWQGYPSRHKSVLVFHPGSGGEVWVHSKLSMPVTTEWTKILIQTNHFIVNISRHTERKLVTNCWIQICSFPKKLIHNYSSGFFLAINGSFLRFIQPPCCSFGAGANQIYKILDCWNINTHKKDWGKYHYPHNFMFAFPGSPPLVSPRGSHDMQCNNYSILCQLIARLPWWLFVCTGAAWVLTLTWLQIFMRMRQLSMTP